jgi:hypothetical protein
MTSNTSTFNPQELCSRKLWDIVNTRSEHSESKAHLEAAIAELEERRGYLSELHHIDAADPES